MKKQIEYQGGLKYHEDGTATHGYKMYLNHIADRSDAERINQLSNHKPLSKIFIGILVSWFLLITSVAAIDIYQNKDTYHGSLSPLSCENHPTPEHGHKYEGRKAWASIQLAKDQHLTTEKTIASDPSTKQLDMIYYFK